jgi:hypothetical protein
MKMFGNIWVNNPTPILVTGAHRSGTTWVGRMLAANPHTAYISEPLNVLHRPGIFRAPVKHWYLYLHDQNQDEYLDALRELLGFKYHLFLEIQALRTRRDAMRMGRDLAIFLKGRFLHQRALLKDPFAVFSAPWFAKQLGCQVVITVRHPAGFASSLKRLNWPFDFHDLLNQDRLMQDHLQQDRRMMESITPEDVIGQAALLWKMIYRVVHEISIRHTDFLIVRHEDLSLDPVGGFRRVYDSIGLPFDNRVQETILHSSSSENPAEISPTRIYSVKLDSRANLDNWKKRLHAEEIARIRRITEDISGFFYADEEWR